MPKFRTKPVIVEVQARRYDGINHSELIDWINASGGHANYHAGNFVIYAPGGAKRVSRGDWVIQETPGVFSRIKPDIFEATYEPVTDA